jgi:predicted nucleotidyltransferase
MSDSNPEKQHIIAKLQAYKVQIRALGVERIGLFGSFAQGNPDDNSDVDLLVDFVEGNKTFDNFMALSFFL